MQIAEAVFLVTGAGHRLGRDIALGLAERGASILVHYGTSQAGAEETAEAVQSLGGEAWLVQADLADGSACDALDRAVGSAGRLDGIVHSAASFRQGNIDDIDEEAWNRILGVNLRAPYLVTRALLPHLRRSFEANQRPASVVHLCDLSALHAWSGYAVHGVSKAGLLHLTKTLARELAPEVRVNALIPGAILPASGVDVESEQWRHWGKRLPLQRTGTPEDVVSTVAFLMESGFITGAAIPVDGGENLLGVGARRAPEDQAPTEG